MLVMVTVPDDCCCSDNVLQPHKAQRASPDAEEQARRQAVDAARRAEEEQAAQACAAAKKELDALVCKQNKQLDKLAAKTSIRCVLQTPALCHAPT